jgi:hypothetical protein
MLLLACGAVPGATPSPSPLPGEALYLRAWLSQALPPEATFGWLPLLTVSEGEAIDGNVAVPAIYPGPLLIMPNVRTISVTGQAALVEQARELGLLDGTTDFTADRLAPGAPTAHILFIIDGARVELVGDPTALVRCPDGDPTRCFPDAGTPEAFGWYWQRISFLDAWLEAELGPAAVYSPERLAVVTMAPTHEDEQFVTTVDWPLDTPFADFGQPVPLGEQARCATISGALDLDALLPVVRDANELTRFVDEQGVERSLLVRVLVPDEPSPCADGTSRLSGSRLVRSAGLVAHEPVTEPAFGTDIARAVGIVAQLVA